MGYYFFYKNGPVPDFMFICYFQTKILQKKQYVVNIFEN